MPSRTIMERLDAGETLLLDGGTGSELQRRGADVLKGATDQLKAWSATANLEFADVVEQVHRDYLRVGAEIIISNNFWTTPTRLGTIGLDGQWEEYASAAGRIAAAARDAGNPEAYVAGGMAPPSFASGPSGVDQMGAAAYHNEYADQARLLAGIGVDLILAEYIGSIGDSVAAAEACAEAGLPVFIGVRHLGPGGEMQYGESLADLADALEGLPVDAVLLMCSNPEAVSAGLPILVDAFDGPVGAYPNLGYNPTGPLDNRDTLTNQKPSDGPDIIQAGAYSPSRLAEFAGEWKEMGARIIGGCCAAGPEHIMAMAPVVKGTG